MHDADYVRIPADRDRHAPPRARHDRGPVSFRLCHAMFVTLDISGRIQRAAQSRVSYRYSAAACQLELLLAPEELCL